jgi:hypothetical protein
MANAHTDSLSDGRLRVELLIVRADLECERRQIETLWQRVSKLSRRHAELVGPCDNNAAEDEVSGACTLTHGCLYGWGHESECAALEAEILDERQTLLPFPRERRAS